MEVGEPSPLIIASSSCDKETLCKMEVTHGKPTRRSRHRRPHHKSILQWIPSDRKQLARTERLILRPIKGLYTQKEIASLNTIFYLHNQGENSIKLSTHRTIVMFHSFGTGIGMWTICWPDLLQFGDLYAVDLPGFARSARFPYTGKNSKSAIGYFDTHLTKWVRESGVPTPFVLMGHSLGGYLAANFARAHPEWVTDLILVDPWGLPSAQQNENSVGKLPTWLKIGLKVAHVVSPLAIVRGLGPWGPNLFLRSRKRVIEKFRHLHEDTRVVADYLYHCNVGNPTGEAAFRHITDNKLCAYEPVSEWFLDALPLTMRVAIIYGESTWIDIKVGKALVAARKARRTDLEDCPDKHRDYIATIPNAGHNVYVDQPKEFIRFLQEFLH